MVRRDGVEQLGAHGRLELGGAFLDQPEPEMDVAEQAPFLGLAEARPGLELARAADVVQERGGEQQVAAQARVQLRGLAAERGDADRVLEQAAGVAVVAVGAGGGKRAGTPSAADGSPSTRSDEAGQAGVGDLRREELEEPVELVRVAAQRGRQAPPGRPRRPARACGPAPAAARRSARRGPARAPRRPAPKRRSSRSTSLQTRASTRPLGSTSSSARYGAPAFVRSRRLRATA